ncbi:DNA polymerase III subunit beta [Botrimarina mediterranea]|uniref:Beta sliding clamp n=1 Tax=Botrimarina mediterranea TaxID=2528022 RepID=A0A518KD92_9BACT|nr:DNA polymerase III subunit beta [Botrimarina mediterranea]QDV75729.1 DNA polymerase III subunit beta [Botrimarina mediterranea]
MSVATSCAASVVAVSPAGRAHDAPAVATCDRKALLEALTLACKVAPRRSPKPVLQNVRLAFSGSEGVTVYATDLEQSLSVHVTRCDVSQSGAFLAPARELLAVVRDSADVVIKLDAYRGRVHVVGDNTFAELTPAGAGAGVTVDDYPAPVAAGADWLGAVNVDAASLLELIRGTIGATDTESSRYALGGSLFQLEPPTELEAETRRAAGLAPVATLLAIGTDGRRLHRIACDVVDFDAAEGAFSGVDTIPPARSLKTLAAALKGRTDSVTFAKTRDAVTFSAESFTFSSRLLEGRYPRWRDVVPSRLESFKVSATVGELAAALKAAKVATSEENRGVDFTFGSQAIALEVEEGPRDARRCTFSRRLAAVTPSCGTVEVTLDPRYVLDFLAVLDKRQAVEVETVDCDSAVVLRAHNALAVVMPLARDRN